jgi:hypothetical protein
MCAEALPPYILSKALETMAPLNPEELALWEILLVHHNPKIRYNALSLLDKNNFDPTFVRTHAQAFMNDKEQQIRDRAFRIVDKL